jgi:hypothetical protein
VAGGGGKDLVLVQFLLLSSSFHRTTAAAAGFGVDRFVDFFGFECQFYFVQHVAVLNVCFQQ